MFFKQLHHFAVVVDDLEASVQWYGRLLGSRPERRFGFPEAGIQIAHLTSEVGVRVELIEQAGSTAGPDAGEGVFETTVEPAGVQNVWIRDHSGNLIELNAWLAGRTA